jgi:K+-transporting ATPase KdpF subunit
MEIGDARRADAGSWLRLLYRRDPVHGRVRPHVTETSMIVDYGLAAAVTLGLLAYLVYALIRPEKF